MKAGDDLTAEKVKNFISANQLPVVTEFTQEVCTVTMEVPPTLVNLGK